MPPGRSPRRGGRFNSAHPIAPVGVTSASAMPAVTRRLLRPGWCSGGRGRGGGCPSTPPCARPSGGCGARRCRRGGRRGRRQGRGTATVAAGSLACPPGPRGWVFVAAAFAPAAAVAGRPVPVESVAAHAAPRRRQDFGSGWRTGPSGQVQAVHWPFMSREHLSHLVPGFGGCSAVMRPCGRWPGPSRGR